MKTITLLDTAACSNNIGDEIIMDSVNDVVSAIFPDAYLYRVPTHEVISAWSHRLIKESDLAIIGGTNLLGPKMGPDDQWKLDPATVDCLAGRTVALGVGWHSYTETPGWRQSRLLRRLMTSSFTHSVRDRHTADRLHTVGVPCLNTTCVTMWKLREDHCAAIPAQKAAEVVTTLTRWRADPKSDRELMDHLRRRYRTVWFWSQMRDDVEYLDELGVDGLRFISPNLNSYDRFLMLNDVDYIGTRLHGGIRALQRGKRTLIVEVDNRAAEIAQDTDLPTAKRGQAAALDAWIDGGARTRIRIPDDEIEAWKAQFAARVGQSRATRLINDRGDRP